MAIMVVKACGKEPPCMLHCISGTHRVTLCGPSCKVQQTPGGSAVVQSLVPSMDVWHTVLVLKGIGVETRSEVERAASVTTGGGASVLRELVPNSVVASTVDVSVLVVVAEGVAATELTIVVLGVTIPSGSAVLCAKIVVTSAGYEPSCMVHWVFGMHLVTTSGPCCTVQQTPGGSALVQSLRPSMDVRQSVLVLTSVAVVGSATAVVTSKTPSDIVAPVVDVVPSVLEIDTNAVVVVVSLTVDGMVSIVVMSTGYEPSCMLH